MTPQPLGQNFLASASWRERVAHLVLASPSATVQPGPGAAQVPDKSKPGTTKDLWIEIGPGHGEMTSYLAPHADRVIAIEIDAKLLPGLRALAARLGNVTVVSGDVLAQNLAELSGGRKFRVCGNLPYYITSPIVHHLFQYADLIEDAFIVVQLEVAERLTARPGVRDYGYLSTFAQFYSSPEILLRIPPGAFRPPPKVSSALVALRPPGARARLRIADEPAFLEFLKGCFAQKRKMLRNNLRAPINLTSSEAGKAMEQAGIAPRARAEELTLDEFGRLFAAVPGGA